MKADEAQAKRQAAIKKVQGGAVATSQLTQKGSDNTQNVSQTNDGITIVTRNGFTVHSYKDAVKMTESGGNYSADNGNNCLGAWQLLSSYLDGDLSPAHQDTVAEQYMQSRYGSWQVAYQHELNFNWW